MHKLRRTRLASAIAATLAAGASHAAFNEVTNNNPFSVITSTGDSPSLVMMDLDSDGDLDAVVFHVDNGNRDSYPFYDYGISVWENTGTASSPAFTQVEDLDTGGAYGTGENILINPFTAEYDSHYGHPVTAVDVDGDEDADFLGGNDCASGSLQLSYSELATDGYGVATGLTQYEYNNNGYGTNPFYGNMLAPSGICSLSAAFAGGDLDDDTDVDIISNDASVLRVFRNDGLDGNNAFTFSDLTGTMDFPITSSTMTPDHYGAPLALHDIDGDGDLDLVIGTTGAADMLLFINEGTADSADLVQVVDTTGSVDVTTKGWAAPVFADMDNDGDADLIVVEQDENNSNAQTIRYFRNSRVSPSESSGGGLGLGALLALVGLGLRRRR